MVWRIGTGWRVSVLFLVALILAGGEGTRLRPLTLTIPKPILPIANIPGVDVPQDIIDELKAAGDERALDVGVQIAVRTIKAVRAHCDGVHIMAIKAVDRLPEIIQKAELA